MWEHTRDLSKRVIWVGGWQNGSHTANQPSPNLLLKGNLPTASDLGQALQTPTYWDTESTQLSLGCNLKSQESAFGKVTSDSKNILAQGKIYSSDESGGNQGWGAVAGAGVDTRFPWYLLEPLHPSFCLKWRHCHFLTLMV